MPMISAINAKAKAEELFSKGMYYFMGGGCNDSKAMDLFEQAIKLDENHFQAHYAKGMLLFFNGNLEEAENFLKTVVEIHWTHAPAWSNLAGIQTKLGKTREAEKSRKMAHITDRAHNEEIKVLNQAAKSI